jgi:hypothetical protein
MKQLLCQVTKEVLEFEQYLQGYGYGMMPPPSSSTTTTYMVNKGGSSMGETSDFKSFESLGRIPKVERRCLCHDLPVIEVDN